MSAAYTITIITVVRNDPSGLAKTIDSVRALTARDFEYIIIDGASTDSTLAVAESHTDVIDQLVSEPDQGIYDAMNKGARLAHGDWIIFMNAGDAFVDDKVLSRLSSHLASDADVLLGTTIAEMRDNLQVRLFTRPSKPLNKMWQEMPACHQSVLVRTRLQKEYEFDTSFQWCADHDLLLRLSRAGHKFKIIDEEICRFDCTPGAPRSIHLYTWERWKSSRGSASPLKRLAYFGNEFVRNLVMRPVGKAWRSVAPNSVVLAVRRMRGTG